MFVRVKGQQVYAACLVCMNESGEVMWLEFVSSTDMAARAEVIQMLLQGCEVRITP